MDEALAAWTKTLEKVFPTESNVPQTEIKTGLFDAKTVYTSRNKVAKPKVFILYSLVQTVSTTQQRHLRELVQTYRR